MTCPNCSFENARDAKFCQNCGRPLERLCPNCGTPNAPSARFCRNCGFNLASTPAPAVTTRLSALRQAAPGALQEKIRAVASHVEGERKPVTILFADVVGSTSLAEKLDPEEWAEIISGVHQRVGEAIYRYEGTVAQLLGDGVLAFFGAPLAHEDDPARAVRAAQDIQQSIDEYCRVLNARKYVENFQMRVGVNSGLVVVGNIGSDLHMEYLAIGDTVNLASRLQDAAEPGTVLVSQNTRRLVETLFDFEDKGEIQVKGKTEPIRVYRVISERKGALPLRGIAGLSSPMVGRSRELGALLQVAAEARAGHGSIVSIIGEAGLGKTRLVMEWRKAALAERSNPGLRWVEGRCLSHGASIPFHLSSSVLRGLMGIGPDSPEASARAVLRARTEALFGAEMIDVYPYLGLLLGLQLEQDMAERVKNIEGPVLQSKYIAAAKRSVQAIAQSTPTIIICEDVHWADVSSVELALQILSMTAETPLVCVFTARPETGAPGWKLIAQSNEVAGVGTTRLYLAPLAETDSVQLLSNLLGVDSLPENIRPMILNKAEGNPFFVEEIVRMLIDRHGLVRQNSHWMATDDLSKIEIPETLLGLLTARIDRLPVEVKRTLQIASVIGRNFQVKLLEQVLGEEHSQAIQSRLETLESSGLIRLARGDSGQTYYLRHALVQDAAYESLLKQDRKQLHLAVGEAIEHLYADRLDEVAAILAQHYAGAADDTKTLEYATRAGDSATRLYAYAEARLNYRKALEALVKLPETLENCRRRVDTSIKLVSVSAVAESPERNLAVLAEVEPIVRTLPGPDGSPGGDKLRLARIHYWMGRSHYYRNESRQAIAYYRQVLEEASGSGDEELLAIPSSVLGQVTMIIQGQFGKAEPLLAQAIAPLEKVGDTTEWIRSVVYHAMALTGRGQFTAGLAEGLRGATRAQETSNLTGMGLSHLALCQVYFMAGDLPNMLAETKAAIEAAEQSGNRLQAYIGYGMKAWAEGLLGDSARADKSMQKSDEIGKSLGTQLLLSDWLAVARAEIALGAGKVQDALRLVREAMDLAKVVGNAYSQGLAHRVWAQILAALDPPRWDEVEEHLAASVQSLASGEALLEVARTQLVWSGLARAREDRAAARDHLEKAAAQFEASGLAAQLQVARRLMAEL
jgi:class 3 adenylate cyclase/tetratricopeptide (TPR) repeat protein